jgi:hypothetical protein
MGQEEKDLRIGAKKEEQTAKDEITKDAVEEEKNAFSLIVGVTEDQGVSVQVVPGKKEQITMYEVLGALSSAHAELLTQNIVLRLKQEIMAANKQIQVPGKK